MSSPVTLLIDSCLARRADIHCTACMDICPESVISISGIEISVTAERCSGCGICAPVCPTGAIDVASVNPTASATVECSRVPEGQRSADTAVVPCLGGLTAAMLRETLSRDGVTLVDRGWCEGCKIAGRAAPWSAAVAEVNREAAELGLAARIEVRKVPTDSALADPPVSNPAPQETTWSRRQLFARLLNPPLAPKQPAPAPPRSLPQRVTPRAQQQRMTALRELAAGTPLAAALFPGIEFPADSDPRPAAALCPTGALQLRQNDSEDMLLFDATDCAACGACSVAGATLKARGRGDYTGPETLLRRRMSNCFQCGSRFPHAEGQTLCTACGKDNDLAALAHGLVRDSRPDRDTRRH